MQKFLYALAALFAIALGLKAQPKTEFTVAAMNVDGMPKSVKILAGLSTISLNPDAKEEAGATAIGQKLVNMGYDIIGISEDFNYNNQILNEVGGVYSSGTHRGGISVNASTYANYIAKKTLFDTDGLNILWRTSAVDLSCESWESWNDHYGYTDSGADGLIKKGFRYYLADFGNGIFVDIYILHMDAEDSEGDNNARASQWTQLVDNILANPSERPKIIMGDTNCRYTRDHIPELFFDRVEADGRYTVSDCWVEKCKGGVTPTYGNNALMVDQLGYVQGEIVDKIFYMNPRYGQLLKLKSFKVDTSFKGEDGEPLADHYPVVAKFSAEGYLLDPWTNWQWDNYSDAEKRAYAEYGDAMHLAAPYLDLPLPADLKQQLVTLLTSRTSMVEATGAAGTTARILATINGITTWANSTYVRQDQTSKLKNPSFEEGTPLANGNVQGWGVVRDAEEAFISAIVDGPEGAAIRAFDPHDGDYVFNTWGGTPAKGFFCQQTISLQKGWYNVSAIVATDSQQPVYLFAGDVKAAYTGTDRTHGERLSLTFYHKGSNVILGLQSAGWFEADDFRLTRYNNFLSAKVGDSHFTTIYLPFNAKIPEGVSLYVPDKMVVTRTIQLAPFEGDVIPALTPIVVYAATQATYLFYQSTEEATAPEKSIMRGTLEDLGDIPAYTAYIISSGTKIPSSKLTFILPKDDPNAISDVITSDCQPAAIYTIQGVRTAQPVRGVNIIQTADGKVKKVVKP